jgi:hypothetical protein
VGTDDGRVRLVDAASGHGRWEIHGSLTHLMRQVAMSPTGRFVASVASSSSTPYEVYWTLWEAENGVE